MNMSKVFARCRILFAARRPYSNLKPSYAFTPGLVPFKYDSIGNILRSQTERLPDQEVAVFHVDKVRKTFSELYLESTNLATGLLGLGLRPGDHIAIWAPNVYEWALMQFATAMCGLVMVNINPASQPREIEYFLNKAKVKMMVMSESFKCQNFYETLLEVCPELASCHFGELNAHKAPLLKKVVVIAPSRSSYHGTINFEDIYSFSTSEHSEQLENIANVLPPDAPCNIQFTSGTTGNPKATLLSQFSLINNSYFFGRRLNLIESQFRICSPPPLFHCIGCVLCSLNAVVNGGAFVIPSPSFDPLACLSAMQDERCTHMIGTPTMFLDIVNHPKFDQYDLGSMMGGVLAGAPVPEKLFRMSVEKMNMKELAIAYGTTENSPATTGTALTDSPTIKTTTIGRPLEHTELKVVNEKNETVPIGTSGELCTRGYMMMLEYFDDDVKTKEVIGTDRWYKTGDTATIDADGYVKLVGRAKDMIIRGGENIYPAEIEGFIYSHPGVEEVQIVGVPDERLGEQVCAWIRLRPGFENTTSDEIKQFCKGKLTYYKIPKYIQFKKLEHFPMTVSGKIQKFKIREIAIKELGLGHIF